VQSIRDNAIKRTSLSKIVLVTTIATIMFLVPVSYSSSFFSSSPYYSSSMLAFQQQQEAEASLSSSSLFGLIGESKIPPAYIIVDGKLSRLQLENDPWENGERPETRIADYDRSPQGTISFGERFRLLVPQVQGVFKDVERTTLWVNDDEANANDYLMIRKELVNTRDTRFSYIETYAINAPGGLGDEYTASEVGFKIFLWWQVVFTDGTEQTYLAIAHLEGDPCEEHGWDYHPRDNRRCVELEEEP
jgi:hypothetical protein